MTEGAMKKPRKSGVVPVAGQVVGLATLMVGVFLLAGLPVALVIGGVLMVALSTLREAGWI